MRGAPVVEGPDFIPGDYIGDKEGYTYSLKGPKGEGYYKDFREYLRKLGWSEDMINVMLKTSGFGSPPDLSEIYKGLTPGSDPFGDDDPGAQAAQYADPSELCLMYKFLKSPGPYPDEVDPSIREQYLEDDEFHEVLGMSKDEFRSVPKWKQAKMKEDVGLF